MANTRFGVNDWWDSNIGRVTIGCFWNRSKKGYDWWDSNIRRTTIGWIQNCSYLESRGVAGKKTREIREIISLSFPVPVTSLLETLLPVMQLPVTSLLLTRSSTNANWAVSLYYFCPSIYGFRLSLRYFQAFLVYISAFYCCHWVDRWCTISPLFGYLPPSSQCFCTNMVN